MGHVSVVYKAPEMEPYATYTLPAMEAIVAAWEQHHRNFNTWEYAKKMEQDFYPLMPGKYGYVLGAFWVKYDPKGGDYESESNV